MELPKIGGKKNKELRQWSCRNLEERERIVWLKKIFCNIDSHSKKYTYSYSFHMPVVFLTEAVLFVLVCHVLSFYPVKVITIDSLHDFPYETNNYRFKYIDSYSQQKKST